MGVLLVTIILCLTTVPCACEGNVIYNTTKEHVDICCDDQSLSCENYCYTSKFFPCSCDIHCMIYGSCCNDFKTVCPGRFKAGSTQYSQYLNRLITCSPMGGFPVISSCPEGTSDSEEYRRCTSGNIDNFLDVMPVLDTKTQIYFRNIYCQRCNNKTENESVTHVKFYLKVDTKIPLLFNELWQLIKKRESRLKSESLNQEVCAEQRENLPNACLCGTRTNPCSTLTEPVLNQTFNSFRLYGNSKYVLQYRRDCNLAYVLDLQFLLEEPESKGYIQVMLARKKGSNTNTYGSMRFSTVKFPYRIEVLPWQSITCNFDISDCRQECQGNIPMINDTCYHDFRYFIILLKVRVVKRNIPEVIDDATRKVITDNIIEMKSGFHFSFPWRVLDRSEDVIAWSVCIYLENVYRPPVLHSNELMVNSSFNTLVSTLTRLLRHESFNRTLVVCLQYDEYKRESPSNECLGTLVQKELLQEEVGVSSMGPVLILQRGAAVYVVAALEFLVTILK